MASSTDGFQTALEWSKRTNELLRQKAAEQTGPRAAGGAVGASIAGAGASIAGANAAAAANAAKVPFEWKKALPDIALIIVCVTVVMLALIFLIKNLMSNNTNEQQAAVAGGSSNQSVVDSLMRQNHRPADIAQNAIPILV